MPASIRIGGAWKSIQSAHIRVGGAWKRAAVYMRIGGVWKKVSSELASLMPATVTGGDTQTSPDDALAEFIAGSGGAWSATGGSLGTWISGGAGSNYECRMTTVSGTLTSGTTGTWLSLSTSRTWSRNFTALAGSSTYVGTFEIREAAAPNTILSTTTVTLTATVEPPP